MRTIHLLSAAREVITRLVIAAKEKAASLRPCKMIRLLTAALFLSFMSPDSLAQSNGTTVSRVISAITPAPNATTNFGNASIDLRGLSLLVIQPQLIAFTAIGQTR